jgi:hypothetical protein
MEGYYWRVVDADAGSVIVVLCGICRGPNGPWAAVALAAHPAGFARHAVVAPAAAEPSTRPVPLGRRLDRPSRRGPIGRAAAAIRAAVAGTGLRRAPPRPCLARSRAVLASRGAGGQAEGEASLGGVRACVWTTPRRTWRRTGGPPGLAGHWWWGHTDASAERAEALGSLEKAARHPVARGPRATSRRRPAAVAAFVWAAIGVALTVANDAGMGLVRGVVLLLAAVATGAASVVPQAALRGDRRRLTSADRPAPARRRPRRWYRRTISGRS